MQKTSAGKDQLPKFHTEYNKTVNSQSGPRPREFQTAMLARIQQN